MSTDFSQAPDLKTLEAEAISAFRVISADPTAPLWARLRAAENLIRYCRGEQALDLKTPEDVHILHHGSALLLQCSTFQRKQCLAAESSSP